jgi:thiol:disulfide interchange protein DsbD
MKKWLLFVICFLTAFIANAAPPPSSEIFKVGVNQIDPNTFILNFQIKPNFFLYSDRIKLNSAADNTAQLGPIRLPPSVQKEDKQGHKYTVYRNDVSIPVAVLGNKPGDTQLFLSYQGCADDGFCYAPKEKTIQVTINKNLELANVSLKEKTIKALPPQKQISTHFSKIFLSHNWAMILLTFYGFGLLLSFTPCILPMVPVLSGIIVGHGKEITTRKAFLLSLSYVLSMSVTYAIAGAVVALIGANLQISMQSPWSIGVFSFVFVLLALSMFGFYEFKLPHAWQAKIGSTSSNQRGGHYIGAAIMGCLSTLILSPCVTAPLIGVLTYIAQSKNTLLGSLTLFVLGLGMGTPLLLIGTSAGKWLPESGNWMTTIKNIFGILFLGVAVSLISRIAPVVSMGLWASLLVFSGIFSGALTYSTTNREKFNQSVGLILLAYGFLVLIGASKGATNPLQPLTATVQVAEAKTQHEQTLASIKHAITTARGQPIMLDFYADWCTACKVMDATTFKDARVQHLLSNFKVIKVDVTANSPNDKAILNFFDVVAPPTFVFFDTKGREIEELKSVGESSADEFLMTLNQIKPEA